ncbi:hypothetical protein AUR64_16455 [Haloprofundus marisrubri]|uniref:DUF4097 domain-containing protein n=1 Tax=Haloprofundus marisrubri TaxID=1514971 RepID=A0A0W1R7I5_9EURY|nr:DUF4097 family beta strand repeat-containing protein [Haloprofundus marisrubri]KTG09370.1 hypothetical protein AUR64_16455 [Haloprofundus marisrubri]
MTERISRRGLLRTGAVGLSVGLSGCTSATPFVGKREEFSRELGFDSGTLTVATGSGDVTVSRTDADTVQLSGVKKASSVFADLETATVETDAENGRLDIRAQSEDDSWFGLRSVSVSLDVAVPEGVAVESAASTNGAVTVSDVSGDASLNSVNGDVEARNVDGFVLLSTTNGSVRARNVAGLRGARTTNGDIRVDVPAIDGATSLTSTNGSIVASLASTLDATVNARTRNGELDVTGLSFDDGSASDHQLLGTLGDGTYELVVESTNGDITLQSAN